jgi:hypothetical protein
MTKRETIKLVIVLAILMGVLIAFGWSKFGAWGILIYPASTIVGFGLARLLVKWIEK